MTNLEKARAMKCYSNLVERVELDPDPDTQEKLADKLNCKNCNSYWYCHRLANTLK